MKCNPILIIGAPRSGTNILRDSIAQMEGVGTWDCDELPYLWRYGNRSFPTDEFTVDMANNKAKKYILSAFSQFAKKNGYRFVLEKTCANSLRVEYVSAILPEALFVYIVRDGYDVVSSISERLTSKISLRYSMKKMKYIPTSDMPYYFFEYFYNRVNKFFNKGYLKQWGPRISSLPNAITRTDPIQYAALQWFTCVSKSDDAFNRMDKEKYISIRYEDFVVNPEAILGKIAKKFGLGMVNIQNIPNISTKRIGKGREKFDSLEKRKIESIISALNIQHGYDS